MSINKAQKRFVRNRAKQHCEYCKRSEEILATSFEVDHIQPKSKGGSDDNDNLCCACRDCNSLKSNHQTFLDSETDEVVALFNPRTQLWSENFKWSNDKSKIIALTATGRATIDCLKLNDTRVQKARLGWVKLGWTPPQD